MNSLKENFKPNPLTKSLCLILATLFFAMSVWCVATIGAGALTYGKDAYLSGNTKNMAFTESYAFEEAVQSDLGFATRLAAKDKKTNPNSIKMDLNALKDNDVTFKYYVESVDGTVFTNLKSRPSDKDLKGHRVFLMKEDKTTAMQGSSALKLMNKVPKGASVRVYLEDAVFSDSLPKTETVSLLGMDFARDDYIAARKNFDKFQNKPFAMMLAFAIVSFLVSIALLVAYLYLVGRKETEEGEEKKIAFIDRVPGGIHAIISFSLLLAFAFAGFEGLGMAVQDMSFWSAARPVTALAAAGGFLVLTEFIASVCRSVRSGYGFWKNTLTGRIGRIAARDGKYIVENGKSAFENIKKDPKQLGAGTIILALEYLFVNLLSLLALIYAELTPLGIFIFLFMVFFNLAVLVRFIRRFKGNDETVPVEE